MASTNAPPTSAPNDAELAAAIFRAINIPDKIIEIVAANRNQAAAAVCLLLNEHWFQSAEIGKKICAITNDLDIIRTTAEWIKKFPFSSVADLRWADEHLATEK